MTLLLVFHVSPPLGKLRAQKWSAREKILSCFLVSFGLVFGLFSG